MILMQPMQNFKPHGLEGLHCASLNMSIKMMIHAIYTCILIRNKKDNFHVLNVGLKGSGNKNS